jgi:glycosyltransferase involved in cell wall biosynthesis
MVELLNRCSVLVIPTPKGPVKYGPIGLTSLVDAIALGMPVITADNTVFAEIVEKEKIGLVYKSGDMSDLKRCMQYFLDHPEEINVMGQNAYNYGRTHNIIAFAQKLEAVLKLNK